MTMGNKNHRIEPKYITQIITNKGLALKPHIKKMLKQFGMPNAKELASAWKDLVKDKYVIKDGSK